MKFSTILFLLSPLALVNAGPAFVQDVKPQEATPPAAAPVASAFTTAQLEQMAAPIALYPDALISHVLMAATYPLEVVQAERWLAQNPGLTGKALEEALTFRDWDPSVKALCGVPTVLTRMSDNLEWTQDLGDAFLQQRTALMNAIQVLRAKATASGALESGDEVKVTRASDVIVIESARPEIVYVPTYYPVAVYGPHWYYDTWYYPAFCAVPPVGFGYVHYGSGFFWGVNFWGACDWHHHVVYVNVHHYNDFCARTSAVPGKFVVQPVIAGSAPWTHDPSHRKGVGYRSTEVAREFGAAAGLRRITREQVRALDGSGLQPERPPSGTVPDAGRTNPRDALPRRPAEPLPAPPATRPDARPVPAPRERVTPVPRPTPTPDSGGVRPVPRPIPRPIPPHQDANDGSRSRSLDRPIGPRSGGMSDRRDAQADRAARARTENAPLRSGRNLEGGKD